MCEVDSPIWFDRLSSRQKVGEQIRNHPSFYTYQRDRARIIHSSSFRRLQSKTQIIGPHKSDRHRTRLTHTLEVAQIGSGLVSYLLDTVTDELKKWLPSMFLIEGVCLAHDLGHPPFGHGGEVSLNYMMQEYGGFESNAQTLRIICRLEDYHEDYGLNLSRRTMLGVVKYPQTYSNLVNENEHSYQQFVNFRQIDMSLYRPPKCVYTQDDEFLDWIFLPFNKNDITLLRSYNFYQNNKVTKYKSLDTSIMDLADDIGYGIHDLEDGIAIGVLDRESWQASILSMPEIREAQQTKGLDWDKITSFLFTKSSKSRKHGISLLVSWVMKSVKIDENKEFEHPLLRYNSCLGELEAKVLSGLKQYTHQYLILHPSIQTMEFKGQQMIMELFEAYRYQAKSLLPIKTFKKYSDKQNEFDKMRVICDYIAGMTDNYATKTYAKLFLPDTETSRNLF